MRDAACARQHDGGRRCALLQSSAGVGMYALGAGACMPLREWVGVSWPDMADDDSCRWAGSLAGILHLHTDNIPLTVHCDMDAASAASHAMAIPTNV